MVQILALIAVLMDGRMKSTPNARTGLATSPIQCLHACDDVAVRAEKWRRLNLKMTSSVSATFAKDRPGLI